jgi:integrase
MRGHLRQRGSSWELRVYLGKDAVTGRERYVTRTMKGRRREAERMLNELVVSAERGLMARTSATVGELLDTWFEHASPEFSPKTVREAAGFIERDLRPALGHVPLMRLSTSAIDRYYAQLRSGRNGRTFAPATIRRIHGVLHRCLEQGVRWSWLGVNPASASSPPRVAPSTITTLSPEQLGRLFEDARRTDPDFAVFLHLSASTGARRSELVALRVLKLDLASGIVLLDRGIVFGPDGLVEKDTKTHAARRVAVDPHTSRMLAEHIARMRQRGEAFGTALVDDPFVFSEALDGSRPWFPDSVTRAFRRTCQQAGIVGVRLDDVRHYVATQLLVGGVDVRTVAGRLRHRNPATTLNVYAHFLETADVAAAGLLAGLVSRNRPEECIERDQRDQQPSHGRPVAARTARPRTRCSGRCPTPPQPLRHSAPAEASPPVSSPESTAR